MSRSKHTRPRPIRAASRLRAPDEPRGHGDPSAHQELMRALKEWGLGAIAAPPHPVPAGLAPLPDIRVQRPRPGYVHPASQAEIRAVLRYFGEACFYGLQAIELRAGYHRPAGESIRCGRLVVPGRIILFDQPLSPWRLIGCLPRPEQDNLRRAGAIIDVVGAGLQTIITWPGTTLRDFMLFDVLMHEVGHHIAQHEVGKRRGRIHRTRDHEVVADRFARRCRQAYRDAAQLAP